MYQPLCSCGRDLLVIEGPFEDKLPFSFTLSLFLLPFLLCFGNYHKTNKRMGERKRIITKDLSCFVPFVLKSLIIPSTMNELLIYQSKVTLFADSGPWELQEASRPPTPPPSPAGRKRYSSRRNLYRAVYWNIYEVFSKASKPSPNPIYMLGSLCLPD